MKDSSTWPRAVRRGLFWPVVSTTIILTWLVFIPMRSNAKEVTFKFNPGNGTTFTEIVRYSQAMPEQDFVTNREQKTRFEIRVTDEGYAVTVLPVGDAELEKAADVNNALFSLMANTRVIYDLSPTGALIRVRGMEDLEETLDSMEGAEELRQMMALVGIDISDLRTMAADQWNSRLMFGGFVGDTVELGTVYRQEVTAPLVGGLSAPVVRQLGFIDTTSTSGQPRIKIKMTYSSDDEAIGNQLTAMMSQSLSGMLELLKESMDPEGELDDVSLPEMPVYSDATCTVYFERVVDPDTGLIYGETTTQIVTAKMTTPDGESEQFTMRYRTKYSYVYD